MRVAGLVFFLIFAVLQVAAWDNPDADVWGASVPMWLLILVVYLLGIGAGWAAAMEQRDRRNR